MTENRFDSVLDTLRQRNAYTLASDAGCGTPDSDQSAGARFLYHVRDRFIEALEYDHSDDMTVKDLTESMAESGALSQIADDAPDVYTATMWAEFLDLAAYHEDPTEMGFDGEDMDKGARICLYVIAERLLDSLAQFAVEQWDEQDEEDDES